MRPPRRRYSSVSSANQIFVRRGRGLGARDDLLDALPAARRGRRREHDQALPAAGAARVDDLDAPLPAALAELGRPPGAPTRRCRRCRRRGARRRCRGRSRRAARRPRGSRRSTAARSSAGRSACAAARRSASKFGIADSRSSSPPSLTYRLTWWMPACRDGLARHVVGGVGDDGDGHGLATDPIQGRWLRDCGAWVSRSSRGRPAWSARTSRASSSSAATACASTVRRARSLDQIADLDIETVRCDVLDRQAVRRAMRGRRRASSTSPA